MLIYLLYFIIPVFYFYIYRKKNPDEFVGDFKEDFKDFFGFKTINYETFKKASILTFLMIVIFFVLSNILINYFPEDINVVREVISNSYFLYGFLFILFIFVSVFAEEFFFRAFLVNRYGIFLSSLFFALMHVNYGSYIQLIGAFFLGLLLGYWWKKDKDFYVLFFAHLLYNLFIIILVLV